MRISYGEKLKDPRWQRVRLEILERDEWTCQKCKATDKTLHVHHIAYEDSDPWETCGDLLVTLCYECHEAEGTEHRDAVISFLSMAARTGVKMAIELDMLACAIEDEWCKRANGNASEAWEFGAKKYFAGWSYRKHA